MCITNLIFIQAILIKTIKEKKMTKSDLLTSVINQKISEIIGKSQTAENLLDSLLHNSLHLDDIEMTCSFDGKSLQFTHDYVENQNEFDTSICINESVEFIKNILNQIYYNENINAQLI